MTIKKHLYLFEKRFAVINVAILRYFIIIGKINLTPHFIVAYVNLHSLAKVSVPVTTIMKFDQVIFVD